MPRPAPDLALLKTAQFDQMRVGVLAIDPRGLISYANSAAGRMLQHEAGDLAGRPIEVVEPDAWRQAQAIFEGGAPLLGARLRHGHHFLLLNYLPVFAEGEVAWVLIMMGDPWDSEQGALFPEPYRASASYLEAIMESSFDGLWITDSHGVVVKVNRAALRMVGLPRHKVEGHFVGDLLRDGNFNDSVTLEVLKRKTTFTMVQHLKSGKKILATGSPIYDAEGEIAFVVINDRDITLLDRMRRQLEESEAKLQQFRSSLFEPQSAEIVDGEFMCRSRAMKQVYEKALRVAPAQSTVLISGESGAGKSMLARLIHNKSTRAAGPFVRVDCAAIPGSLFESELFGYAKGAFTGASRRGKAGLVEMAQGGTLFLDEIAELPLEHQVKLLRFIEERRVVRVGGGQAIEVDTRVIAATNKNLAQEVDAGRFREDLYYRFNVVPLSVPPLRERPSDILFLMGIFLRRVSSENQIFKDLTPEARTLLLNYNYPGNVRELDNIIERVMILSPEEDIRPEDLPSEVRELPANVPTLDWSQGFDLRQRLRQVELELIQEALKRLGTQRKAAQHLGVSQSTIARRLQEAENDS
ncbi:MAG: sigma 54-interacting transcriptional regulator [Desulfarculaceae bacterium]|nr:sigma 54-interacting transcriptional regulator [Desulfarculaceae bacterium]